MKYRKTLTVGSHADSPFRHIIVDYPNGHPIRLHNQEVGRFLIRDETWKGGIRVSLLEGIEIDPEFRGKGIARAVIRQLLERVDMIIGSVTEDDCKPFWVKVGAKMRPLPLESFPTRYLPSIHTQEPQFFYITKNPKAADLAEQLAVEVPKLLAKEKASV